MKTIVPESMKAAAMAHPNYQQFERIMKRAYGVDWELITPDEAASRKASKIKTRRTKTQHNGKYTT